MNKADLIRVVASQVDLSMSKARTGRERNSRLHHVCAIRRRNGGYHRIWFLFRQASQRAERPESTNRERDHDPRIQFTNLQTWKGVA